MKRIARGCRLRRTLRVLLFVPVAGTAILAGCSSSSSSTPGSPSAELNITQDITHRYGEPELAVNPTNPNNMIYLIMSNMSTYKCERSGQENCAKFVNGEPLGFWTLSNWTDVKLFVTFDRGRTWSKMPFPDVPAFRGLTGEGADHSDLLSRADPLVTVTANGTFYIGWDAVHYCQPGLNGCLGAIDGGIVVSKSTDGGRSWSTPVLTGTGVDRPWMVTDLSSGMVYEASAGPVSSAVSTGNAKLPIEPAGQVLDRHVVSSTDGVHWSDPQPLGGGRFSAGEDSTISAANGVLAAVFPAHSPSACRYFVGVGSASCTVFETSTDSGATWSRHAVPTGPVGDAGLRSVMVAADPAHPGTFTVAALNATSTGWNMLSSHDSGSTWARPVTLTDDPKTQKFKAWISYSPEGVLGMIWRSNTRPGSAATIPYQVFASTSNDQAATWSRPLRISGGVSPGSDPLWKVMGDRDDTSQIVLDADSAIVGWGDWRPGEVQGFLRVVPLRSFKGS